MSLVQCTAAGHPHAPHFTISVTAEPWLTLGQILENSEQPEMYLGSG